MSESFLKNAPFHPWKFLKSFLISHYIFRRTLFFLHVLTTFIVRNVKKVGKPMICVMIMKADVIMRARMIMKTHKLLRKNFVFSPEIWCICRVSRFRTISYTLKHENSLWRSVIFSKVLSCKATSLLNWHSTPLLKLALHSSPCFLDYQYMKTFLGKFRQPWNFLNFSATSAEVCYKLQPLS